MDYLEEYLKNYKPMVRNVVHPCDRTGLGGGMDCESYSKSLSLSPEDYKIWRKMIDSEIEIMKYGSEQDKEKLKEKYKL